MVVKSCGNIDGGLPARLRSTMMINVIIDFVIGLVPFIGDLADAVYKCNTRNAVILEKHLRQKGARTLKNQKNHQGPNLDTSLAEEFDRHENSASGGQANREGQEYGTVGSSNPTKPQPSKHPQRNRSQGGWFGGSKTREGDIERDAA